MLINTYLGLCIFNSLEKTLNSKYILQIQFIKKTLFCDFRGQFYSVLR